MSSMVAERQSRRSGLLKGRLLVAGVLLGAFSIGVFAGVRQLPPNLRGKRSEVGIKFGDTPPTLEAHPSVVHTSRSLAVRVPRLATLAQPHCS